MERWMDTHQLPLFSEELTQEEDSPPAVRERPLISPSNGSANRMAREDAPIHSWYRFVLSFPPHLVREYLHRFGLKRTAVVLDPFCGTGTTIVECKKIGLPSVGVEAHPMAHLAASVKVDWNQDPEALLAHATDVAEYAIATLASQGLTDIPTRNSRGPVDGSLLTLPEEKSRLLLRDSISPLPLHRVLVLVSALSDMHSPSLANHERLALAQALVTTIGNLHFGPEVGIGEIKQDAPVIRPWLHRVRGMAADILQVGPRASVEANVILGDSRSLPDLVSPTSIDAVFTSPPYPNEKDYTRTTRLESVILGLVNSKDELRSLKKTLVRSNTRSVYREDTDDEAVSHIPEISEIASQIEDRRTALGKTSGFERMYHRVALQYFGGMARHFKSLQGSLRPGAMLAYVVGDQASYLRVMIRTGQLLGKIAASLGYEVVSLDLFRTRLATATREQLREEVLVLRWPG